MLDSGQNLKKETRQTEMIGSASDVEKVMTTVKAFLNPFTMNIDDPLTCISSDKPVTPEIENDLLKLIPLVWLLIKNLLMTG